MDKNSKIFIIGHDDIIEKALRDHFKADGFSFVESSSQMALNATIQPAVYEYFQDKRPEYVFLGSTLSGGIQANIDHPADFIYHNLASTATILYAAQKFGVQKLIYFASSCVYPRECPQPMTPDQIFQGPMEPTGDAYSTAKLAGIKMCQAFRKQHELNAIVMIPATVYGPDSDVDPERSHVMGALMNKFHQAVQNNLESVEVWGTGSPRREFLYQQDFVEAVEHVANHYDGEDILNVGWGEDCTIKELAEKIASVVGFKGQICFNDSKPDGVMKKCLDSQRMHSLGWKPRVSLDEGLQSMYQKLFVT